MRRDVFHAIADPTRREIIQMIATKEMPVNGIAENFDVSRPAISKHLKILMECGLVEIRQDGRERYCHAKVEPLKEVADWVSQYRELWESRLDALENYLYTLQTKKKKQ